MKMFMKLSTKAEVSKIFKVKKRKIYISILICLLIYVEIENQT